MIICRDVKKSYEHHSGGIKQVLKGVNFAVRPGERLALLGRNGAGKSTLLKLIGGVELPTSGKISRGISVSWPLGFAGGFQGSLTGYDNTRFIARIYQRDLSTVREFVEEFTGLGRQLKMPVKTYSSGMRARLAFALSLAIDFDCYLIDEVILVGDQDFQRKCHVEFFEKRAHKTMIIASHSTEFIKNFCNTALIIDDGISTFYDDVDVAVDIYVKL